MPRAAPRGAQTGLTAGQYSRGRRSTAWRPGSATPGQWDSEGSRWGRCRVPRRKHGLTIDDLLAAELVTADGELLHVDDETHADLFWAIRGGGGNFGVATASSSGCTRWARSSAAC